MDNTAKVIDSVGAQIMKAVMVELEVLSPPYAAMLQEKKQEVIDRMRDAISDQINHAVHSIAARGNESVPVTLIKASVNKGIRFQVDVIGTPPNSSWVEQIGKECMLVFCDPTGFKLGLDSFRAPADQKDAFGTRAGHDDEQ